jgi:hypothetical protein
MTTPVNDDDLVQGCVKWLLDEDDVHRVLGVFPQTNVPWLYQHTLWNRIEGTQSQAAVIARAGGWAGANDYNTLRFPRLSLEIYVDPIRDSGGNQTMPGETNRRIEQVWRVFDNLLHRPSPDTVMWGDIRVITSTRLGEPTVYVVPDGDGSLRLQQYYAITQG